MRMRRMGASLVLVAGLVAGALVACEDDNRKSGGGEGEGEGEGAEGEGEGAEGEGEGQQESATEVEATVKEEGGETRTENNTQAEPSEAFGAVYAGRVLSLFFLSSTGTSWTFIVDTENKQIPGTLPVEESDGDVHGTLTELGTGGVPQIFTTDGTGTLRIDTCPKAMGQQVEGAFVNIGFTEAGSGAKRTLNGSFTLEVRSSTGELNCKAEAAEGEGEGEGAEGEGEGAPTCDHEICADTSANCCPYMECMAQCILTCAMTDMTCMSNPANCYACITGCWDGTCNVSAQCKTAATALDACEQDNGCDTLADEESEACSRAHCCDELKAAY